MSSVVNLFREYILSRCHVLRVANKNSGEIGISRYHTVVTEAMKHAQPLVKYRDSEVTGREGSSRIDDIEKARRMDSHRYRDKGPQGEKLLDQVRRVARTMHLAMATEKAYVRWIEKFLRFVKQQQGRWRHPEEREASTSTSFSPIWPSIKTSLPAPKIRHSPHCCFSSKRLSNVTFRLRRSAPNGPSEFRWSSVSRKSVKCCNN